MNPNDETPIATPVVPEEGTEGEVMPAEEAAPAEGAAEMPA